MLYLTTFPSHFLSMKSSEQQKDLCFRSATSATLTQDPRRVGKPRTYIHFVPLSELILVFLMKRGSDHPFYPRFCEQLFYLFALFLPGDVDS
jgi:hypothetical protein